MKDKIIFFIIFLFICRIADGAQTEISTFAEPAGYGNAYCGRPGDIISLWYNPANIGILDCEKFQVALSGSKYFVSNTEISEIMQFGFGVGIKVLPERIHSGILFYSYGLSRYKENLLDFSVAQKTSKFLLGLGVKYLWKTLMADEYTRIDPLLSQKDKISKGIFSLDAGFNYFVLPNLYLGISFLDLFEPNFSLYSTGEFVLKRSICIGVFYRYKRWQFLSDIIAKKELLELRYGMGFSFIKDILTVQAGINFNQLSAGFTSKFQIGRMNGKISYAVVIPYLMSKWILDNKISLILNF